MHGLGVVAEAAEAAEDASVVAVEWPRVGPVRRWGDLLRSLVRPLHRSHVLQQGDPPEVLDRVPVPEFGRALVPQVPREQPVVRPQGLDPPEVVRHQATFETSWTSSPPVVLRAESEHDQEMPAPVARPLTSSGLEVQHGLRLPEPFLPEAREPAQVPQSMPVPEVVRIASRIVSSGRTIESSVATKFEIRCWTIILA
jgi:hypothetical protein